MAFLYVTASHNRGVLLYLYPLSRPPMRRSIGIWAVVLLLIGLFLYHTGHTKFPTLNYLYERPTSVADIRGEWSANGYRRYTSSKYLKHENATRTLRGQLSSASSSLVYTNSGCTENLLEHERYMVAFYSGGGFTNAFITLSNQIYTSILASRIPVIHPFQQGHLAAEAGFLPVSEVFDLGRWALAIHTDILELEQIKNYSHENDKEQIGCWSIWMVGNLKEAKPSGNPFAELFKLGKCHLSWDPI